MSLIEKVKSSIGKFHFNSRLNKLKRKVVTHNLQTAKTAGIIFSNPDEQYFNHIKDFLTFLSQKDFKVVALGYIPAKKIPEQYLMRKNINFYCKKDLNWYNKPNNEIIEKFINQKFDILFDLSMKDYFTINYVGSLSSASFKVGRLSNKAYQDLTIDISKEESVSYLIEHIKHYLNILNNN